MNQNERREIEERIRSLSKGTITIKHISGKEYEYWQFRENGKQITKRVKGTDAKGRRRQACAAVTGRTNPRN